MTLVLADGRIANPATLVWERREIGLPLFIEDGGRTWSWHDVAAAAAEVARRLGPLDGARATVTLPNGGAIVAAITGVWLAGGVPVLLSPRLPASERRTLVDAVAARRHVADTSLGLEADVQVDAGFAAASIDEAQAPGLVDLAQPGLVLCTSGTTGLPKTVVHSLRAVWGQVDSVARGPVDPGALPPVHDRAPNRLQAAPMVHISAVFAMMFNLWKGRSTVIMQRFEPVRYAELVAEHQLATLSLVPSMIRMLLDSPVKSLAPARLVTAGTAALPPAWREEFETRFGVPVQATYGQTEAGTIAVEPMEDVLGGTRRPGTAGRVVPSIRMEVRDGDGTVLPTGEAGHLWIAGETTGRLAANGAGAPPAGWVDTGDLGRLDADGYVYLTGRSRDLIIRGGLNIIPAEVENALNEHERVLETAVTGRDDARLGEVPVAWVRLSGPATDDELRAFLRDRIAAYKVPVAFRRVESFPRTDTGKIRKHDLAG